MSDPGIIFTGQETERWITLIHRGNVWKPLTPFYIPESTSKAEAQERSFLYLRMHPELVNRWRGWTLHHTPGTTGIHIGYDGEVIREGA